MSTPTGQLALEVPDVGLPDLDVDAAAAAARRLLEALRAMADAPRCRCLEVLLAVEASEVPRCSRCGREPAT